MAKIAETMFVVKASKLLKDSDPEGLDVIQPEVMKQLEDIIQELAGADTLVEIIKE